MYQWAFLVWGLWLIRWQRVGCSLSFGGVNEGVSAARHGCHGSSGLSIALSLSPFQGMRLAKCGMHVSATRARCTQCTGCAVLACSFVAVLVWACMARSNTAQRRHDLRCWTTALLQCSSESVWTSSSGPVMEPEQRLAPALSNGWHLPQGDRCRAVRQAVRGALGRALLLCNPGWLLEARACMCVCASTWIDPSSGTVASLSLLRGAFERVFLTLSLALTIPLLFIPPPLSLFLCLSGSASLLPGS